MKTAVFSDIHGNIYALEAMFRQLESADVDQFIFCGDIMGYFLWQDKVIRNLQRLPNLYAVMGNHDFYYLNTVDGSRQRIGYAEKYGKSYYKKLGEDEKKYLESLPVSIELHQAGKRILIVHGSAEQPLEGRVYPDTEVEEAVLRKYDIVISGHTHYRMYRKTKNAVLLNPGSLGQPRDRNGYSYCIMDMEKDEVKFKNVCIDQKKLLHELLLHGESEQMIKYMQRKMGVIL